MTRTLVTGGCGFVGQHLVATLRTKGCNVRVLDLRQPPADAPEDVHYVQGSVLDPSTVGTALDDVEDVYHLAGLPGMWTSRKSDFHAVNCRGTEIVIDAARERRIARFLHCSTESILFGRSCASPMVTEDTVTTLDDMPGAYTRSKMLAEQRAAEEAARGFPVVIANPTMPIGHHHGSMTPPTMMVRHFLQRRVQIYIDFIVNLVDVRDVAAGLVLAMEHGRPGSRYILGGEDMSLRTLLLTLEAVSGRKAFRLKFPLVLAGMTAAVMEFLADHVSSRPPAATVEGVRIASRSRALSIEKSRRELGYAPQPIEAALRATIESILEESDYGRQRQTI